MEVAQRTNTPKRGYLVDRAKTAALFDVRKTYEDGLKLINDDVERYDKIQKDSVSTLQATSFASSFSLALSTLLNPSLGDAKCKKWVNVISVILVFLAMFISYMVVSAFYHMWLIKDATNNLTKTTCKSYVLSRLEELIENIEVMVGCVENTVFVDHYQRNELLFWSRNLLVRAMKLRENLLNRPTYVPRTIACMSIIFGSMLYAFTSWLVFYKTCARLFADSPSPSPSS